MTVIKGIIARVGLLSGTALVLAAPALAQTAPVAAPSPAADPAVTGITGTTAQAADPAATPDATSNAAAQSATAPANGLGETEEIVVTGIRGSLQSATTAKRNSVAFGDSIFAEDIGKLPATNLAETLNRIPGVRLNRDITGEGVQVAIRGLGPSFTKVLLNNTQISIASDGGTNGTGGGNREVDLDFFPSELFTRLDVAKTPVASTLEGGIAGTVNLRNARPFDNPGTHVTVVGQGQYSDSNKKAGPRGAIVASHTTDTFGILVGVSGVSQKQRIDSFDTIGWTDANVPSCGVGCTTPLDTGNGFSYASVVPNNVGHGLTAGAAYDPTATSGLTLSQLSGARLPRLGRNVVTFGKRERISGLVSLEWRPSDELHFALDAIGAISKRDFQRTDMNWQVRNSGPGSTGGMVPINLTVDENNVVTSGTFANASFFSENVLLDSKTTFWNVNPSVTWAPSETFHLDAQLNYGKSSFNRDQSSWLFQTPRESGVEAYFDNTNGDPQPIITTNRDLGDPNLGWQWYRAGVQLVKRDTETRGAHLDATFGEKDANIKVGLAYDQAKRSVRAYDSSTIPGAASDYQLAVCGTGCTGTTGVIPNSALGQYIKPLPFDNFGHLAKGNVGYTSFAMIDFDAIKKATNYEQFKDAAPQARGAVTGGTTGDTDEKTFGAYAEGNGAFDVLGRELRVNAGLRYVRTKQYVVGPSQVGTTIVFLEDSKTYDDVLPSFNLSYDVMDRLKLRISAARTLTRANASDLLPGLTFSDISAQNASAGNPDLKPYTSNNLDIGAEYYTGGIGYVGVAAFRKDVDGFTATQSNQVRFADLGVSFATLQTQQQQALTNRAADNGIAVDDVLVNVNRPVNLQNLVITGVEVTWVQPLDFVVKGLGFSANGTRLKQKSDSGLTATGISPWLANIQGFYEGHGVSLSLNYVWQDKSIAANAPQQSIQLPLRSDARGQLDLSAGYQLPWFNNAIRLTVDALNLTNAPIRTTFGYDNATSDVYYPGRQILVGFRAKF
jgi:TonB-dependent receptor